MAKQTNQTATLTEPDPDAAPGVKDVQRLHDRVRTVTTERDQARKRLTELQTEYQRMAERVRAAELVHPLGSDAAQALGWDAPAFAVHARNMLGFAFNVSSQRVPESLGTVIRETVLGRRPELRTSALRMLCDGRLIGVPAIGTIVASDHHRVHMVLALADLCETLRYAQAGLGESK